MKGQRDYFRQTRPLPTKLWACLGITDELCSIHLTRANALKWRSLAGCEWRTGYRIVRVEVSEVTPKRGTP